MSFGKDIYVPLANIDMVEFKGSNSLIKDGAIPITDISDIDEYIKYCILYIFLLKLYILKYIKKINIKIKKKIKVYILFIIS